MTIDEMKNYLSQIQASMLETKILNAILAQQEEIEMLKTVSAELQEKVNEIINAWNTAAALNSDIQEDKEEEVPVE